MIDCAEKKKFLKREKLRRNFVDCHIKNIWRHFLPQKVKVWPQHLLLLPFSPIRHAHPLIGKQTLENGRRFTRKKGKMGQCQK
jgi:hypothetical protein